MCQRRQKSVEVFGQVDAKKLGHAPGDVDAAGEVTVELDAVEQDPDGENAAAVVPGVVQHRGDQHGGPVCDD